jgi:uncharacterized metal-binding protein YceD (DUF177 family)
MLRSFYFCSFIFFYNFASRFIKGKVKNKHEYNIVTSGLHTGKHFYTFEINASFFDGFQASEIRQGTLKATVTVDKKSSFLQLEVHISGHVTVACDRCLDDLEVPIEFNGAPIVKFTANTEQANDILNDDDDILWVDSAKNELDMTQYFFDSIMVSLPIQCMHAFEKCNKEMIAKLVAMQAPEQTNEKNLPFEELKGKIN